MIIDLENLFEIYKAKKYIFDYKSKKMIFIDLFITSQSNGMD